MRVLSAAVGRGLAPRQGPAAEMATACRYQFTSRRNFNSLKNRSSFGLGICSVLRRLTSFVRHLGAVATATATLLVISVHTASSDRPFQAANQYGQTLLAHVLESFAQLPPFKSVLSTNSEVGSREGGPTLAVLAPTDTIRAPTIGRVVVGSDGTATLSGQAAPGVKVALRSDRRSLAVVPVSPVGRWTINLDRELTHGVHRVQTVALLADRKGQVLGEEIRLAVPQTLSNDTATDPQTIDGVQGTLPESVRRVAQADDVGGGDDVRRQRDEFEPARAPVGSPFVDWLRRSSEAYDDVIVHDLSGGEAGLPFIVGGRDDQADRARTSDGDDRVAGQEPDQGLTGILRMRWRNFQVGITEWFRQAQESYRADVVENLSVGERTSRDRYVRRDTETENERSRRVLQRQPPRETTIDRDPPAELSQLDDWPVVGPVRRQTPKTQAAPDWPVVQDDQVPTLPEVRPDAEKERLIRQAEEDARRARQLAREAAEQAERARKETEALLAEEQRLKDAAARADREEPDFDDADIRASAAKEAEDAIRAAEERAVRVAQDREAQKQAEQDQAEQQRAAEQRKAAEELAAAATAEADKEFAAGRVGRPPDDAVAVARADRARRLSMKDSASDHAVEEGSALGDIDDFHPSVRYVYDMGHVSKRAKSKQAKRARKKVRKAYRSRKAKRRISKKRRAKRRAYKHRRARSRRAYRTRGYRKRYKRYRRRAWRSRWFTRAKPHRARRAGRAYVYKARRYRAGRRRACRRKFYLPRFRWRRG